MDMNADFLPRLRRPKDPHDRHPRAPPRLRRPHIVPQLGVVPRRRRLVVVDAVQSDPEGIHGRGGFMDLWAVSWEMTCWRLKAKLGTGSARWVR